MRRYFLYDKIKDLFNIGSRTQLQKQFPNLV